jgi:hypothetical protein
MVLLKCDPAQTIDGLIQDAIQKIPEHPALENWSHFSLTLYGRRLKGSDPVSTIFDSLSPTAIPSVVLRRELPAVEAGPDTHIFKNTIMHALAKCQSDTIPYFMTALMRRISTKIDQVGIYRKSGLQTTVDAIAAFIDTYTDPAALDEYLEQQQAHEMACALKLWFRTLSEPLIPQCFNEDIKAALAVDIPIQQVRALKLCLHSLPTPAYDLLKAFAEHIAFVLTGPNEMTPNAVAICVGQNFFKSLPDGDVIKDTAAFQAFAKRLFEVWRFIFLNEPYEAEDLYVKARTDINVKGTQILKGGMYLVADVTKEPLQIVASGSKIDIDIGDFEMVEDILPPMFDLWDIFGGQINAATGVQYREPGPGVAIEPLQKRIDATVADLKVIKAEITTVGEQLKAKPDDPNLKKKLANLRERLLKM